MLKEVIKNFIAITTINSLDKTELNKRLLRIAELRAEPNNGLNNGYIPLYKVSELHKANPKAEFYYNFDIWRLNNSTNVLFNWEGLQSKLQISSYLMGLLPDAPALIECIVNDVNRQGIELTESLFLDLELNKLLVIHSDLNLENDSYLKYLKERKINLN